MLTKAVLSGLVDAHNHVGEAHSLLVPGWLEASITGIIDDTSDVLIDGVFVRRNSKFTFLDESAIIARARQWGDKFSIDYHRMKGANHPCFTAYTRSFSITRKGLYDIYSH
jgi:hypothetical protein